MQGNIMKQHKHNTGETNESDTQTKVAKKHQEDRGKQVNVNF